MRSNFFKRVTAGVLALLMLGTALPVGSDFTGLFGGTGIVASAEAEEAAATLDLSMNDYGFPTVLTTGLNTYSNASYSVSLYASSNGYKHNSGYLLIGKNGAYLELPEFNFDVEKIVVTGNSSASDNVKINAFVGDTAVSTETTGIKGTQTYEINENYQAAGNKYRLKINGNYNAQFTKIEVFEKKASTVSVTNLAFTEQSKSVTVDDKVALTAEIAPDEATDRTVKWSVTDGSDKVKLYSDSNCTTEVGTDATSTLTVYAKGLAAGEATVTVTSNADSSKTDYCTVTVNEAATTELTTTQLTKDALPSDTTYLRISDLAGFSAISDEQAAAWKDVPKSGGTFLIYGGEGTNIKYAYYYNGQLLSTATQLVVSTVSQLMDYGYSFYYTSGAETTQATVKTAPQPCDLTYSGEGQALVTAGEAENGTMQYQIGTSATVAPTGTWSDSVPSQTDAGDYYVWYRAYGSDTDVTEPACVTATISQKTVTVSGITSNDKAYDKSTTALLITDNAAFDGIVTGDTLTVSAEGAFADANAGEDKTVNITGLTLGGTSAGNYVLAQTGNQTTTTADILQRAVKVSMVLANDKTYDGTATAELVTKDAVFENMMTGDSLTVSGVGTFVDSNVGTDKIVELSNLTLGGESAANYIISPVGTQTATTASISKRAILVSAADQTVPVGSDIDTTTNSVVVSNAVDGHTLSAVTVTGTPTAVATKEGSITPSAAVIKSGETDVTANYDITYEAGRLTVCEKDFIVRAEGSDRYDTAAAISQKYKTQADTVVLASGLDYADALAGVPLASKLNAPLLLTGDKSLNDSTLKEIKRLGAKNVIILGGEGAISPDVEKALQAEGLKTERVAGKTRFSTATAIAQKVNENPTDIFFVYGLNYPDALSVSAAAAIKNAPVIYLTTDGELNAETAQYLEALKAKGCVKNAYVIGGDGVISDDMMNQAAKALGIESATRVFGQNRYLTGLAVLNTFADVLNGDAICVATGTNFPDALAGCVFAASKKMPMLLVASELSDEQKAYLSNKRAENIYVLGGTGAVSDEVAQQVANSIKVPS